MVRHTTARPFLLGVIGVGLLATLMIVLSLIRRGPVQEQVAGLSLGNVSNVVAQSPPMTYTVYLPLLARKFPVQPVFGVQMAGVTEGGGLTRIADAPSTWVGGIGIVWSQVEANEGDRNWSVLGSVEQEMLNAADRGLLPVVNVRYTPGWAQMYPSYTCGPIAIDKLGAFARFMHDLVARYSVAPYNVRYWEIWNEPDVDPSLVPADSPFGCWGNASDDYYGGGHYGNMLKEVYPAIKAADPQAQVLVGGLLLDCDPANTSICKAGKEKTALFLEGILHHNGQNDGGQYFDGVSFHGYDYYQGFMGSYYNPNWQSTWNTTGPVGIAKAHFLEGVLSAHGVTGKFLMNNEAAILCASCNSDATFEATKAYYVAQAYATAIAEGWRANIWYSALGWRNSGLLNPDLSPKPAYEAFRAARSELQDARLVREITEYAAVKGYAFDRGDRQVWVMWSLDGAEHVVTLPFTPYAVFDVVGGSLAVSSTMTVTLSPVYVER